MRLIRIRKHPSNTIKLFVIVGEDFFCLFDEESHLTFLKVEIGNFGHLSWLAKD